MKKITTFSDLMGQLKSRQDIINSLKQDSNTYLKFQQLHPIYQEKILNFLVGKKGIEILYDGVFQHILNPNLYPERLEDFLLQVIGEPVKIKEILPRESSPLSDHSSIVIMDILVQLQDNSLVNVEMQKIGYRFPSERSNCYMSDLIMRQYNKVKATRGDHFSYKDMNPVYTIVIMEESPAEFRHVSPHYIHRRNISYDSKIQLRELEHIYYITLDIFHSVVHNVNNRLDAWLTFLSSEEPERILKLVNLFPEFAQYYQEIAQFRTNPKELILMYSKALRQIDLNTERFMYEEMKSEIAEMSNNIAEMSNTIAEKDNTIAEKNNTIAELNNMIAQLQNSIEEMKKNQN